MDWRKLFRCQEDQKLTYFPPKSSENSPIVCPPPEVFETAGLSYISRALGTPISMDNVTASKIRLHYAKVCVEIGAKEDIPEHSDKNCPAKQPTTPSTSKIWRKKTVSATNLEAKISVSHEELQNLEQDSSPSKEQSDPKDIHTVEASVSQPVLTEQSSKVDSSVPHIIPAIEGNSSSTHHLPHSGESVQEGNLPLSQSPSDKDQEPISIPKRGRGRPIKVKSKVALKGSANRFKILNVVDENSPIAEVQVKKTRSAASGVANLLKELKAKKKEQIVKNLAALEKKELISASVILLTKVLLSNATSIVPLSSSLLSMVVTMALLEDTSGPYLSTDMKDLLEVVQDLLLQDHPFFGPSFTWSNKQKDAFLARKLDRVLINSHWANSFNKSFIEFFAPGPSDHCMTLVWLNKEAHTNRPKPFKFFNFWSNHHSFLDEVRLSWQQPIHGNPIQAFFLKLKRLKPCLQALSKNSYNNLSARVKLKKTELEQVQISTLKGTGPLDMDLSVQNELAALEEAENLFLKKKSKVKWLKEGDKCTKYFHSIIATKNKNDTIRVLINAQGKRLKSFEDMASEVLDFFKHQLGFAYPNLQ
ncbi:uncharacterized protein LOC120115197 [Hibiscus syriacus]|uniref:uncharacterized protein LOC120115197 n=1 Tax=Hibiscus syriacus TaxID=106335 RepID=UPI0019223F08|nr:uncharacterized protein LOC120115197 [Hibiscus syriacus]